MNRRKGYKSRQEAGEILADSLLTYRGKKGVVLAVPRGGVPVALPVVEALDFELDIIIPRKIGAPHQSELAVGAVCEDGEVLLNPHLIRSLGITDDYIDEAAGREVKEIKRRLEAYRGTSAPAEVEGRIVIVIDDGVATGFTITAALQSAARRRPGELVLAVPVAPPDTLSMLAKEADNVVCPYQPEVFYAVGQFYQEFPQLKDDEVREMLRHSRHGEKGISALQSNKER
ncbi:MAG: phosphoribosyltransferase [Dethiobacter sp.]|jgi:predicted phosphoribosyltransferase|nr:phosphoribosyltransferase [Dethiobacter sp.]